jgi:hypothetical protein
MTTLSHFKLQTHGIQNAKDCRKVGRLLPPKGSVDTCPRQSGALRDIGNIMLAKRAPDGFANSDHVRRLKRCIDTILIIFAEIRIRSFRLVGHRILSKKAGG